MKRRWTDKLKKITALAMTGLMLFTQTGVMAQEPAEPMAGVEVAPAQAAETAETGEADGAVDLAEKAPAEQWLEEVEELLVSDDSNPAGEMVHGDASEDTFSVSELVLPEAESDRPGLDGADDGHTDGWSEENGSTLNDEGDLNLFDGLIEEEEGAFENADWLDEASELEILDEEETGVLSDPTSVDYEGELAGQVFSSYPAAFMALDDDPFVFTDFGSQLDARSRVFYDARVDYHVTQRKAGTTFAYTLKDTDEKTLVQLEMEKDSSGKLAIKRDYKVDANGKYVLDASGAKIPTNEAYLDAKSQISYVVQSATDAFCYDHPEVFWMRPNSYGWSWGYVPFEDGKQTHAVAGKENTYLVNAYVKTVTFKYLEAFTNASSYNSKFFAGVETTAEKLRAEADLNSNGTVEQLELIQTIHDYVVNRFWYDSEMLSAPDSNPMKQRIRSAAAGFIDDPAIGTGVVCEGYAKTVKILCDYFGIPCCLVKGKGYASSTEGHMWNLVKTDYGWFMLDATWDDAASAQPKYLYYLCHTPSSRVIEGDLNGAENALVFTYPTYERGKAWTYVSSEETQGNSHCYREFTSMENDVITYWKTYPTKEELPQDNKTCMDEKGGYGLRCESCGYVFTPHGHDYDEAGKCKRCDLTLTIQGNETVYSKGDTFAPKLTISYGDQQLTENTDFSFDFSPVKTAGEYAYSIQLSGYYQGTLSSMFTVKPCSTAHMKVTCGDTVYSPKGLVKPAVQVTEDGEVLKENVDYQLEWPSAAAAQSVGEKKIKVIGIGNYAGEVYSEFKIKPRSLGLVSVKAPNCVYNAQAQRPTFIVTDQGKALRPGFDYSVTYSNDVNVGRGTALLTGRGNYILSKQVSFNIVPERAVQNKPASKAKRSLTVGWKKTRQANYYEIQLSLKKDFSKIARTRRVSAKKTSRKTTFGKLKSGKKYYVRVRAYRKVGNVRYYGAWSKVRSCRVK